MCVWRTASAIISAATSSSFSPAFATTLPTKGSLQRSKNRRLPVSTEGIRRTPVVAHPPDHVTILIATCRQPVLVGHPSHVVPAPFLAPRQIPKRQIVRFEVDVVAPKIGDARGWLDHQLGSRLLEPKTYLGDARHEGHTIVERSQRLPQSRAGGKCNGLPRGAWAVA